MHLRARAALPLALLAVLSLLGTAMTGGAATTGTVNVADASGNNVMDPSATTIKTGDAVKFHWNEGGHNVHFTSGPEGDFDLGYQKTGYETTHTFSKAGTYSFVCDSHSKMKGTITVQDAGSGTQTPPPPPPSSNTVSVANAKGDNVMDPSSLSIKTGDAVKFHWNEGGHNVHFKNSPENFDLGYQKAGYDTSHTFTQPGTYSFVCDSHSSMKGTIRVTGQAVQPAPPPAQQPPSDPPATDPPATTDPQQTTDPQPTESPPATSSSSAAPTATAAVASTDTPSDAGPPAVRLRAAKGTLTVQASEPVRLFMRAVRIGARGHRVYKRTLNLRRGANTVYLRDWLWGKRYRLELTAVDADRNAIKPVRMRIAIR